MATAGATAALYRQHHEFTRPDNRLHANRGHKITEIDVTAEPASLAVLSIALPASYRTEPVFHPDLAGRGWDVR
jgi:hypothetical protein